MLPWLTEFGFTCNLFLFIIALAQSGKSLFFDQSPPPITLPALTEASPIFPVL